MDENTHGEPFWDQTTTDRLWVTTQTEVMIESALSPTSNVPVTQTGNEIYGSKSETVDKKVVRLMRMS